MFTVIESTNEIKIDPKVLASIVPPESSHFLFDGLSSAEMQYVINNSLIRKFKAGRILIQQGDISEHLYFIINGSAKSFRCNADGHEITIRMLQTGETFMESAIFMDGNSPIAAQVIDDSEVLMLPKAFVKEKVMRNNQFAHNLLRIVTQHYKNIIQQVDSISTKSPVQRVGYFLLKLRMDQVKQGIGLSDTITLPFRKSMIANHLNMTPETFSRSLKKLGNLGVKVKHDKIILESSFALCQFCDSDMGHFCHRYETDDCPIDY